MPGSGHQWDHPKRLPTTVWVGGNLVAGKQGELSEGFHFSCELEDSSSVQACGESPSLLEKA